MVKVISLGNNKYIGKDGKTTAQRRLAEWLYHYPKAIKVDTFRKCGRARKIRFIAFDDGKRAKTFARYIVDEKQKQTKIN